MMSLRTKCMRLMKFLCANSQGIEIIGTSASEISVRDLKGPKQILRFPKSIEHC